MASPAVLEAAADDAIRMLEQADDADDRRGIDRPAVRLVVQADVAAGDRHAERAAGLADALDGLRELPHDRGPLGVAEVEAVGRAERTGAGAGDVARRFGHREHRAAPRVEIATDEIVSGHINSAVLLWE